MISFQIHLLPLLFLLLSTLPASQAQEKCGTVAYEKSRDPRITFDLDEKETVRIQVLSILGQTIAGDERPDILNQTYHFDLGGKPGIYIVKIQIGTQVSTAKISIPN